MSAPRRSHDCRADATSGGQSHLHWSNCGTMGDHLMRSRHINSTCPPASLQAGARQWTSSRMTLSTTSTNSATRTASAGSTPTRSPFAPTVAAQPSTMRRRPSTPARHDGRGSASKPLALDWLCPRGRSAGLAKPRPSAPQRLVKIARPRQDSERPEGRSAGSLRARVERNDLIRDELALIGDEMALGDGAAVRLRESAEIGASK